MTLKEVAELMKEKGIPKKLLSIEHVYNFAQDRENRSIRFVRIVVRYQRGEKVLDIAERYKCSETTVKRYARLAGIPIRDKFMPVQIKGEVIRQLRLKLSLKAISQNLDVSESYISKVAKTVGLNRYKRGLTRKEIRGQL